MPDAGRTITILIGADPATIERGQGDPVRYLTSMFIDAARTFRTGIHFLTALIAVLFWIFDARVCIAITLVLAIKFVLLDDFPYLLRKRRRLHQPPHLKP